MEFLLPAKPAIRIGERVYQTLGWKRRDDILLDGERIGIITLSSEDRTGVTISMVTGHCHKGRAIDWCVLQSHCRLHTLEQAA
ncbi:hypothetical protein [Noviherbaspirillum pedocola]|uniref:Uncharacterized protein n=1 Tax=Noviherbaspirillum pedocola TaxID=2801341 RepID=A0A934W751_9BURK|nr:hypothetical protein [Noviherbaspirillum pedocola]MBK4735955.1 hypothetical protein [Noviherbaspirillum pedocola]